MLPMWESADPKVILWFLTEEWHVSFNSVCELKDFWEEPDSKWPVQNSKNILQCVTIAIDLSWKLGRIFQFLNCYFHVMTVHYTHCLCRANSYTSLICQPDMRKVWIVKGMDSLLPKGLLGWKNLVPFLEENAHQLNLYPRFSIKQVFQNVVVFSSRWNLQQELGSHSQNTQQRHGLRYRHKVRYRRFSLS